MKENQSAQPGSFLRVSKIIPRMGISKSYWWKGVAEGRFPKGIKLSPRVTVWRSRDIDSLIESL